MTAPEPLVAQVCALVGRRIHALRQGALHPEAELTRDLDVDPLDRVTIACDVEEHFNLEFHDAEIEGWATPADIACSVARRQQVRA